MADMYSALAKEIKAQVDADADLTTLSGDIVWFEDELPNKEKAFPQATLDSGYSVKVDMKETYHAQEYVAVSLWYERTIANTRNVKALVEGICLAVHRQVRDGVHICVEDHQWLGDPDTGLSRFQINFELTRVSAA